MAAVVTALVLAASLVVNVQTNRSDRCGLRERSPGDIRQRPCFGAGAMDPKHDCPAQQELITTPAFAKDDFSDGITDKKCLNWPPYKDEPIVCHRGDTTSPKKRIALFGNSHAGQWVEAMSKIGRLAALAGGHLHPSAAATSLSTPILDFCAEILATTTQLLLAGDYDLVVMRTLDPSPTPALARPLQTDSRGGESQRRRCSGRPRHTRTSGSDERDAGLRCRAHGRPLSVRRQGQQVDQVSTT